MATPQPVRAVDGIQGITILAKCGDGTLRAVLMDPAKTRKLLNFVTHQCCGGVLRLTREPIGQAS